MAEVWEGRDDILRRPVAVKMLLPHLAADPSLQERFRREAVTAARLVHPGIVAIFDAGVESMAEIRATSGTLPAGSGPESGAEWLAVAWPGQPTAFIIMELVPGETLRDLMARSGPLPPSLAVAIASQVTDALAHAHAHGLVHRDVKPANILLRDEGGDMVRVKVADFGIAKAAANVGDLTANGAVLGTPKYISPEQVQGREPDARADLYSLGVVLFEMLAGRPPFPGGSDMATALAHVQQPAPSLNDIRPGLPAGLPELVSALLVKDPDYRLGSALVLGASLTSMRKRLEPPDSEPGPYLHLGTAGLAPAGANGHGQALVVDTGSGGTAVLHDGGSPASADRQTPARAVTRPIGRRRARSTTIFVGSLLLAGSLVTMALVQSGRPAAPKPGHSGRVATPPAQAPEQATPGAYRPLPVVSVQELTAGWNHPDDDLNGLRNLIGTNTHADWASARYDGPDFGGSGGFGLALELAGRHVVHDLVVTSPMEGWTAEAFVGDAYSRALGSWGRPTARLSDIIGGATFPLGNRKASWVLLWMIDPGPTRQAMVDKLSVR
jgi:serine/threonine-protein kinase